MTLKERCTNAHAFLVTKRKELEGLIIEYREFVEETHPMELVTMRGKFVDYAANLTSAIMTANELSMQAEHESRQNYLTLFFGEKEKVETSGKITSDEKAKRYSEFKNAEFYMVENSAKLNYYMAKELKSDAQSYINEINQRIPITKDEFFNSRQSDSIRR